MNYEKILNDSASVLFWEKYSGVFNSILSALKKQEEITTTAPPHSVSNNEVAVCNCVPKPKNVPKDGYEYICNNCRKPISN